MVEKSEAITSWNDAHEHHDDDDDEDDDEANAGDGDDDRDDGAEAAVEGALEKELRASCNSEKKELRASWHAEGVNISIETSWSIDFTFTLNEIEDCTHQNLLPLEDELLDTVNSYDRVAWSMSSQTGKPIDLK